MPINVWAAGSDDMLNYLAQREAEDRLLEDRRIREEQRLRDNSFRDRQVATYERDKENDAARIKATADNAAAENKRRIDLMAVLTDPTATQREREQAGLELNSLGVTSAIIDKVLNPKPDAPTTRPVFSRNPRTGALENLGDIPKDATLVTEAMPEKPRAPAAPSFKDDPELPVGTKQWIDSISLRGVPIGQARNELSKGWRQQTQAHPRASLAEASRYLNSLYPTSPDPMDASPQVPLGSSDAAPAAAPGGGGMVKLMAPTGEIGEFPPDQAQALIAKGAKVVQ